MPFAPHLAEELWEHLGEKETLLDVPFPTVDPKDLEEECVTYVIQVNGRVRGRFDERVGLSKEDLLQLAKKDANVGKYLNDKEVIKAIFVPNKLLNVVV